MARAISPHPSHTPAIRDATRLLSMVHELHKAGYQRLRFWSGMAPSGMYWRCLLTHADNIGADYLTPIDQSLDTAHYTTGDQDRYFGWADAPGRSARELAVRFVERYPAIAAKADGTDWGYAGWLTDVLGRAEVGGAGALPIFYADYPFQQKTKRPVQFELMDTARKTMRAWLERRGGTLNDFVFPSRNRQTQRGGQPQRCGHSLTRNTDHNARDEARDGCDRP